ncbi:MULTISPECIES: AraC family transcriptional regulator [unclassified Acinetobacter]|uniref:AraC family transcriptional regulator n=1 Tax=unclassified Acinetobacter TaxID=196816 RepID=UPI00190E2E3C|nr:MULTISPECIES: AraC family transcriptional regulator [unclassified Acinetobacter]MBK0062549.1 helix-turn-helix domain-containing protein [Acinetobacter sp. S55]MBK0066353.1 helix-turn-helix domain-containing protein [Acinetobacter sp. S54]
MERVSLINEFEQEKQKILNSYFSDLTSLLKKNLDKNELEHFFKELSFSLNDIEQQTVRFTFQQYLDFLVRSNKKLSLPGLGLRLGAMKTVRNFGIYGYALMSSENYTQFTEIANKIFDTIYESLSISHCIENDQLVITYNAQSPLSQELYIILMEQVVTCGISLMQTQLPENIDWSECILKCNYPVPAYNNDYVHYFLGEILFDQPFMQLCVPASWLSLRLNTGNPFIFSLCENKVETILNSIKTKNSISNQLKHILLTSNFNQLPTVENIADQLHMSDRNLRIHLSKQGTSYREILNEVRNELACRYLKESSLSIQQISFSLGYGHVQNFYRAFLKNNQITPEKFRQQLWLNDNYCEQP